MAKLSKTQIKNHEQALELLKKDTLTMSEKEFVFNNYHEGATNLNSKAGAFFSPLALSWEFAMSAGAGFTGCNSFVDLCAGIGVLAYSILQRDPSARVVCVEFNPDYVAIGKKLVPEATWYCADVMDLEFIRSLGSFDVAVSNPPFGAVATFKNKKAPRYTGSHAEYKVMDIASEMARDGVFIVPQESAGFKVSGQSSNDFKAKSGKYVKFSEQTGIQTHCDLAIDTTCEDLGVFKDVNVLVEFVSCDFSKLSRKSDDIQMDMFGAAA